jgi:hypothetical protein
VTENHIRDIDLLDGVFLDGYTATVIHDRDNVVLRVDLDFDRIHRGIVDLAKQKDQYTHGGYQLKNVTLLSAALTNISSTILKKPGTYWTSLRIDIMRRELAWAPTARTDLKTILFVSESNAHIFCLRCSTLPMYESGRLRICSICESYDGWRQ